MRGKVAHVYCNGKTFSLNDIETLLLSNRSLFSEQHSKNKEHLERFDVTVTWDLPIKRYSAKQSFNLVYVFGKDQLISQA